MAKKERPINVLLIDDKVKEMHEFIGIAKQNRVIIKGVRDNSEAGIEELTSSPGKYDAVILDAKAFRKVNQEVGTESLKSLRDSINGIKDLERKSGRKIPFCVYTGHKKNMGEAWEDDLKVFVKGRDQEVMFKFLKEEIKNLPETIVIQEYYDVFELFDLNYLDSKYKAKLLYILMNFETKKQVELENLLLHIRKILEGVYKTLGELGRIDSSLIPRGRPNLEYCQRYISGLPIDEMGKIPPSIVPSHISWSFKIIKENASAAGAHDYQTSIHNYSLKTMVFALLDVLLWFKGFRREQS